LYAQVTGGLLRYGTLLELLRSCTASVSGIAAVDDGFRYTHKPEEQFHMTRRGRNKGGYEDVQKDGEDT
jgi:hypothetical protein